MRLIERGEDTREERQLMPLIMHQDPGTQDQGGNTSEQIQAEIQRWSQ